MRKYRIIKETNLHTSRVRFIMQARIFIFFWTTIDASNNFERIYDRLIKRQTKPKFKREEVAIDNIYV